MFHSAVEDLRWGILLSHDFSALYFTCLSITGTSGAPEKSPIGVATVQRVTSKYNPLHTVPRQTIPRRLQPRACSHQTFQMRQSLGSHCLACSSDPAGGCFAANRHSRPIYDLLWGSLTKIEDREGETCVRPLDGRNPGQQGLRCPDTRVDTWRGLSPSVFHAILDSHR